MFAYASYVDHNWYSARHTTFQYLTEVPQDEFPFFVDLDIADEIADDHQQCLTDRCCKPATFGDDALCGDHAVAELTLWVSAMCQEVQTCINEKTMLLLTDEVVANAINLLH
jgi:hypothetical protein